MFDESESASCETMIDPDFLEDNIRYLAYCPDGKYNPLAALFWSGEGAIIRNILQTKVSIEWYEMLVFTSVWYFWTIITYGTNVPAGLFLPGMIIGCGCGDLFWRLMIRNFQFGVTCPPESYGNFTDDANDCINY